MKNRGVALVEILIGAAIMSLGILAVNSSYSTYVKYALANQKNVEATRILEEGLEVVSFFRDSSWTNISRLSTSTTYYLSFNGSAWATTTTPQYVDGQFLRSISVSDLKRDSNDDISSSGTYDPNIKQITATVSFWQGHATSTISISEYISNIR